MTSWTQPCWAARVQDVQTGRLNITKTISVHSSAFQSATTKQLHICKAGESRHGETTVSGRWPSFLPPDGQLPWPPRSTVTLLPRVHPRSRMPHQAAHQHALETGTPPQATTIPSWKKCVLVKLLKAQWKSLRRTANVWTFSHTGAVCQRITLLQRQTALRNIRTSVDPAVPMCCKSNRPLCK